MIESSNADVPVFSLFSLLLVDEIHLDSILNQYHKIHTPHADTDVEQNNRTICADQPETDSAIFFTGIQFRSSNASS
jgi:hypothetical protein